MRILALTFFALAGCVPKEPPAKPTQIVFDREFRDILRPDGRSRSNDQLSIDVGGCFFVIDLQPRLGPQREMLLETCMKGRGWTLLKRTPRVEDI